MLSTSGNVEPKIRRRTKWSRYQNIVLYSFGTFAVLVQPAVTKSQPEPWFGSDQNLGSGCLKSLITLFWISPEPWFTWSRTSPELCSGQAWNLDAYSPRTFFRTSPKLGFRIARNHELAYKPGLGYPITLASLSSKTWFRLTTKPRHLLALNLDPEKRKDW